MSFLFGIWLHFSGIKMGHMAKNITITPMGPISISQIIIAVKISHFAPPNGPKFMSETAPCGFTHREFSTSWGESRAIL